MNDPDIWDNSLWELKPGFTEEDERRGEELLQNVFDGLLALREEGFSRGELRRFLRDSLDEMF